MTFSYSTKSIAESGAQTLMTITISNSTAIHLSSDLHDFCWKKRPLTNKTLSENLSNASNSIQAESPSNLLLPCPPPLPLWTQEEPMQGDKTTRTSSKKSARLCQNRPSRSSAQIGANWTKQLKSKHCQCGARRLPTTLRVCLLAMTSAVELKKGDYRLLRGAGPSCPVSTQLSGIRNETMELNCSG